MEEDKIKMYIDLIEMQIKYSGECRSLPVTFVGCSMKEVLDITKAIIDKYKEDYFIYIEPFNFSAWKIKVLKEKLEGEYYNQIVNKFVLPSMPGILI